MIEWYWAIVALIAGVFIGWFFCSLAWVSHENERGKYIK